MSRRHTHVQSVEPVVEPVVETSSVDNSSVGFCHGCGYEKSCAVCNTLPLSPCPKKVLIECGTPGSTMTLTATGDTFDAACLTIDTSCFSKPIIELDFSSLVSTVLTPDAGNAAEVALRYDLIARRNGGNDMPIGSWTFRRALPAGASTLETTDSFSFSKCMCTSACQGGYTDYIVRVTATFISQDATPASNANATISMGQLIARCQNS